MRIFTALLAIVPLVTAGNYNLPCPNDMMCGYICCSPGEICDGARCLPPSYISNAIVSNLPKSEAKSVLAALSSGDSQVVSAILTAYDTLMTAAAPMPTFAYSSNIYSTSTPCKTVTHTGATVNLYHTRHAPPPPAVTTVANATTAPNVNVSSTMSIPIQSGNGAAGRAAGGVGFVAAVAGAVVALL